ncbi:MAG: extracellular solute-binding protein, partial [Eubacterium sp.]
MKKKATAVKKVITGILASTMVLSGCSGSGTSPTAAPPSTTGGMEAQAVTEEAPAELTVMAWDRGDSAPGTTADNNALTKWITAQVLADCNIKVTFVPVPRKTADDKLNVMMAGGSAPDIVFTYTRTLVMDYAEKGGLLELTPYLEQYGTEIQKNLGDVQHIGYMSNGQYALMQKAATTADGFTKADYGSYIRKDWVDKLGKKLPTNQEELLALLHEFKEKDPGNVGADKLIPWAMSGLSDGARNFLPFVSSYAETCDEEHILVYDDRLAAIAPGTKEALQIMNQLYNEGIISKDFPVDTSADKYIQDITNG